MDRPGKKGRKMESKGVTIEQRKRYKTMRKAQRKRWRARKKATREMGERTVLEEQGKLLVTLRRKVICEQSAMGMMEGRRTEKKEEIEGEMDEDTQEKGEEMHHHVVETNSNHAERLRKAESLLTKAMNINARASEMMQKCDQLFKE